MCFSCGDLHEGVRGPLWTADHSIRTVQCSRWSLRTTVASQVFWSLASGLPWKQPFAQNDSILAWVLCRFLWLYLAAGVGRLLTFLSQMHRLFEGGAYLSKYGKLLYIIDMGMCCSKGYGFQAVFLGNWIWIFTFFAWKWVCFVPRSEADVEFNWKLGSKRPQKSQLGCQK